VAYSQGQRPGCFIRELVGFCLHKEARVAQLPEPNRKCVLSTAASGLDAMLIYIEHRDEKGSIVPNGLPKEALRADYGILFI